MVTVPLPRSYSMSDRDIILVWLNDNQIYEYLFRRTPRKSVPESYIAIEFVKDSDAVAFKLRFGL